MRKNNYYECYSVRLKDFLYSKGIYANYKGIHNTTKKRIWIFEQCDNLSILLKEYSKMNKNI